MQHEQKWNTRTITSNSWWNSAPAVTKAHRIRCVMQLFFRLGEWGNSDDIKTTLTFFSVLSPSHFYFSSMAKLRFVNCCTNKRIWMNEWMNWNRPTGRGGGDSTVLFSFKFAVILSIYRDFTTASVTVYRQSSTPVHLITRLTCFS